ncbi:hypothetical protein ACQZ6Q_33445 [Rhizobium rhizogenes]
MHDTEASAYLVAYIVLQPGAVEKPFQNFLSGKPSGHMVPESFDTLGVRDLTGVCVESEPVWN